MILSILTSILLVSILSIVTPVLLNTKLRKVTVSSKK
jgi:hypothetical protein